jgi:hypothetical protein
MALFAVTSLINLSYGWEELRELHKQGPERYLASATNLGDLLLVVLVLYLALLLANRDDDDATSVAAGASVLLLLKAPKASGRPFRRFWLTFAQIRRTRPFSHHCGS